MEPMKVRAKPVEMLAVEWTGKFSDLPRDWRVSNALHMEGDRLIVETPYGRNSPTVGSYVLLGTSDEFFIQSRAIFAYRFEGIES